MYLLKVAFLTVFLAVIPALFYFENVTSILWTVLIPLIPILLLALGFSRWRELCPLASIAKITQKINLFQKRKVPLWFEKNFWYFQYALLFTAFSFRLTTLNFHTTYLAFFLIFTILSALAINLIYTGKSWCNFFCPVSAVEKIYSLSNAKNYTHNSACSTCTACKKNCPDIDLESNYWKEGVQSQKNFVFFSFSGLILGFYLYFYLYSGSFTYYFSGEWTYDKLSLLSHGFFFAPFIPVFIAVPLTLIFFSFMSYTLFYFLEQYLWKKRVFQYESYETLSHRVKVFSAFIAFNLFYIFAGAPSFSHYPLAYALFYFFIVSLSSMIFYKEIFRKEDYFIQERFALKIVKRWNSSKKIPKNLKEIYYTYMNENNSKKERLNMYKLNVTELLQEGILNDKSMKILQRLREQIGISQSEHDRVMQKIKQEHKNLFDNSIEKSTEKEYQEKSFREVIENALNEHIEIDKKYLKSLQTQFCISDALSHTIMQDILNTNDKIFQDILNLLELMHQLLKLKNSIYSDGTREIFFLKYSIKNEFRFALKDLFSILFILYKDNAETIKRLLKIFKGKEISDDFHLNHETLKFMETQIVNKIVIIYHDLLHKPSQATKNNNKEIINTLLLHDSIQISLAALLNTKENTQEFLTKEVLDRFCNTYDTEILSLVYKLVYNTNTITTYERMMYLNYIPLFKNLKFHDLHMLGQATKVNHYTVGQYVIRQGDTGDTLYILVKGSALVEIDAKERAKVGHREYFGEIALLGDTTRQASIKITAPTIALTLTKRKFKLFLHHNPKAATKVMKEVIKKLI